MSANNPSRFGRLRPGVFQAASLAVAVCMLSACSAERAQSTASPGLDSGVTSSSGGGTQTLNNRQNVGVTTPTGR